MKVPDWIEAPGDLPRLESAIIIAEEAAGFMLRGMQRPFHEDCDLLPCEVARAIDRLVREARRWRKIRGSDSMPHPVSLRDWLASSAHRIALDAVDAAEQAAASTCDKLLKVADVGYEADGLKVIERTIETIPPDEITALRERLRAEGKLETRKIKAVIRTGED